MDSPDQLLNLLSGKTPPQGKDTKPLLSLEDRHALAERAFDLVLTEVVRRLEESPGEQSNATLREVLRLITVYRREFAPDAQAAIEREREMKELRGKLQTDFPDAD